MSGVMILAGQRISSANSFSQGTGDANVLTPSPREVFQSIFNAANYVFIDIDFGAEVVIDTLYVGGAYGESDTELSFFKKADAAVGAATTRLGDVMLRPAPSVPAPPYQALVRFAATAMRYARVQMLRANLDLGTFRIGTIVAGRAWSHPYAFGSGRQLIDTSRRAELVDGGFGVEHGVSKAAFRWRFIDLTAAETDALWALTYGTGMRQPVVVVEDDGVWPPPDAKVHYGLFDKFEAYERANPVDTQWALSMTEWR